MSAPVFAKGKPTVAEEMNGQCAVIAWEGGPAIMLSRHDFIKLSYVMRGHVGQMFDEPEPQAQIIQYREGALCRA
ncbi:hypothetical protein [Sphingomicrobium flavum]|uniref:hypothetical protein n=1 Tax=Sphingomicrobium flavum TaxID=1229164 RepID=UPI0021ADB227|nr:hypothetical protein [Sphingomicrobium flavum]